MTQDDAREVRLSQEQRHEWSVSAIVNGGVAGADGPHSRILALLDALDAAEAREADAEQRGMEDSSDHNMCYVHGSRALEARLAEAWDEGYLRGTLDATSDLEPADNPYRADRIAGQTGDGR